MIYLASPYSASEQYIVMDRHKLAIEAVALLTNQGHVVYSPIVHFHPVAMAHQLPKEFVFWREINFHMLDLAERLLVLQLPQWDTSIGVVAEITHAINSKIPIDYCTIEILRRG